MITSSMDRTLTTKSVRLREWSQWTAATTLIAAGTLALFSATTLDKLSGNGEVSVDLTAFKKLGSASLALDRTADEQMIAEEARLLDRAAYAAAEALPRTHTAFTKIRIHPRVRPAMGPVVAKNSVISTVYSNKLAPAEAKRLAGMPITLSKEDAAEIRALEQAPDPAVESQALAQVYRNLRFQFIAAVEREPDEQIANTPESKDFPADSIAIANANTAREYDEVPEFDAAAFALPKIEETSVASTDPSGIETAPTKVDGLDSISNSSSSAVQLTADPSAMKSATNEVAPFGNDPVPSVMAVAPAAIVSPGLDLIPDVAPVIQESPRLSVSSHETEVKQATGPPEMPESPQSTPPISLQVKSPYGLDAASEKNKLDRPKSAKLPTLATTDQPADLREYSKDIAAAYQGTAGESDKSSEYSNQVDTNSDSIIDGDFSARPADAVTTQNTSHFVAKVAPRDYGQGVSKDAGGITIDWNKNLVPSSPSVPLGGKVSDSTLGGKIFVGKPGETPSTNVASTSTELKKSLEKFSFTPPSKSKVKDVASTLTTSQSSAVAEPVVDTKKCETARIGVEAFNSGAEKETLSICRRELSLEGSAGGSQARWWESYENEAEHWPTLSFAKPNEASPTNRTPLLSTASIRILSAVSKTNTHTGTGIVFGEVAKGLEIQLLGRSDTPIYLEGQFVFLNVEPGQPLLVVKNREKNLSGAIPLVVKSGMATHLKVQEPRSVDLDFTVFDASAPKETRLSSMTAEVIGQPGKMGITDKNGTLKIRGVAAFDEFPIYVDLLKNDKSYKNRFRIRPSTIAKGVVPLFFFDEKRVDSWLSQLAGGLSPYSGLIAGVAPASVLGKSKDDLRFLKIGILEKKSSLVPERYLLDERDQLVTDSALRAGRSRYVGVQIPEGPAIPTIVDGKGVVQWSELVYAQPGVINVVNPDL